MLWVRNTMLNSELNRYSQNRLTYDNLYVAQITDLVILYNFSFNKCYVVNV
jgi:hypothetical protein